MLRAWFAGLLLLLQPLPAEAAVAAEGTTVAAPSGVLRGTVDLEASRLRFGENRLGSSAKVELEQEIDGWAGDPHGAASRPRAVTDAEGRFRISGLSPGFYTLKVEAGGIASLIRRGVQIEADRETVITEPLVLRPPIRLPVRVDPAADPWQRSWKVRLVAEAPRSHEVHVLAESATDADGLAVLQNLEEGEARLEALDGDGRTWLEQPVEIYPERPELFAAVDVVQVEGRLYFGREPLAGELSFGTTQGLMDIRMASGEDGRFHGYLPREGSWAVEILWPEGGESSVQRLRDVEIRRRPGKSYADPEVHIPATELQGRVLAKGGPVAGAGILVGRDRNPVDRKPGEGSIVREAILLSDAEGRFRLRGIEKGEIWLIANRGVAETSGKVRLTLEEGPWPSEVVLELEEKSAVRGMVTFGTLPVAGARILALPTGSDPAAGGTYVDVSSDDAGQFELWVPASAERIDALIAAPSLGIELVAIRKVEGRWPSPLIALSSEKGTLRCQWEPASGGTEFTHGLVLDHGGARLRWMPILRALTALGLLELGPGEVLLHGLAPGLWASCQEGYPGSCRSGVLPPNGEISLAAPRKE